MSSILRIIQPSLLTIFSCHYVFAWCAFRLSGCFLAQVGMHPSPLTWWVLAAYSMHRKPRFSYFKTLKCVKRTSVLAIWTKLHIFLVVHPWCCMSKWCAYLSAQFVIYAYFLTFLVWNMNAYWIFNVSQVSQNHLEVLLWISRI